MHGEDTKSFCAGGKDVIDCMSDDKNRYVVFNGVGVLIVMLTLI